MRHQLSELVEECQPGLANRPQLLDPLAYFLSSFIGILVLELLFVVIEKPLFLEQGVVDKVVIEKLREHSELLDQELVDGVYRGGEDADAVGADGV